MTIFVRLLRDRRRGAISWTGGTVFAVAAIVGLWPSVKGNTDIEDIVQDLPAPMRAAFGLDEAISISSAPGYLHARLFSTVLPILLVVYAIGLGARAIGGAEEDGTLQLVATGPVTRLRIALERFAASLTLLVGLAAVALVATLVIGAAVGIFDDVSPARTALDAAAVTALAVLFLALSVSAGAISGRRGSALSVASTVAVGTYVLHATAASAEVIRSLRVLSPWWWLLDRNLLVHSPTFLALGLPLVLGAALVVTGLAVYQRRDLRFP